MTHQSTALKANATGRSTEHDRAHLAGDHQNDQARGQAKNGQCPAADHRRIARRRSRPAAHRARAHAAGGIARSASKPIASADPARLTKHADVNEGTIAATTLQVRNARLVCTHSPSRIGPAA